MPVLITDEGEAELTGLEGKTVVVLGGYRGIGLAAAIECATDGAQIWCADLFDYAPPGQTFQYRRVDATDEDAVNAFIAEVVANTGRIDALINCVGRTGRGPITEFDLEEFDAVFRVNVRSVFLSSRAVLPHMIRAQSGSIVNLSSHGGLAGRPNDPVYSASKHAVIGLTRALAVAYADQGIRINAVCPGPIDTPMLHRQGESSDDFTARLPRIVASTPAARFGTATEVARCIKFLASSDSSYITGTAIPVDGGKAAGVLADDRYRHDFTIRYPESANR